MRTLQSDHLRLQSLSKGLLRLCLRQGVVCSAPRVPCFRPSRDSRGRKLSPIFAPVFPSVRLRASTAPRLSPKSRVEDPPQGFFRIIKNQRGGGDPSPKTPSPPPQTKVTIVGKNEIYNRENLVRPFLVHQVLGPKPPPPLPPPCSKRSPDPPPPPPPTRPGHPAHHRCATVARPQPPGPVLH